MISLGFTGTRDGLTDAQKVELKTQLTKTDDVAGISNVHHGMCIGADTEFDEICVELGIIRIGWPGFNPGTGESLKGNSVPDTINEPLPYLERNQRIVYHSEALIACPKEDKYKAHSGTWITIKYAEREHKPTIIIFPDGSVKKINP